MAKKLFIFSVFIITAFSVSAQRGCLKSRFSETNYFDSASIKIDDSISYGSAQIWPSTTVKNLQMDIYYPDMTKDSLKSRPFIMLIHGGAFLAGDRADMKYQCQQYAQRGFVAATISYRLGWDCKATNFFEICLQSANNGCADKYANMYVAAYRGAQDTKAAMRFIHANADKWNIDTSNLFIGGESAGSINALHATFVDQKEADKIFPGGKAALGLIDTACNNLTDYFRIRAVVDNCGAVYKDSVILNNGVIPVISFHDENDCVVPQAYGQLISCVCQVFPWSAGSGVIYQKLSSNNIPAELNYIKGSVNHCSFPAPELVRKASCFMKRVMCGDVSSSINSDIYKPVVCSSQGHNLNVNIVISDNHFLACNPNPAAGKVEVLYALANVSSGGTLRLFDGTGKNIISIELEKMDGVQKKVLDISALPAGIYFMTVVSGGHISSLNLSVN